ncbi:uncharacterized protein LOC128839579 isoform X1 [Malaclemys terrapin pileata]|uniref:uncharacterized protein LOC128839579 isoform X1 n=1 Tax=Malaclemys terrapin pileata TaxID=2991368 RepID=UPI0023A83D12|nr:uncharacterized protein LOC128839579 isoform X1 [Malaclemys terrapin pileata]
MKARVRKTNQLPLSSPGRSFRGLLFPLCCWETMELFKWSLRWLCLLPLLRVSEGQSFLIKNIRLEKCMQVAHQESDQISLADCKLHAQQQQWRWDPRTKSIVSLKTKQCLTIRKPQEFASAYLEPCGDRERQAWACSKKGHLTLHGLGLHLNAKQGHKVFVSREKDKFSKWKTLSDETVCAVSPTVAPRLGDLMQEVALVGVHKTKTISSSAKSHTSSRGSLLELPASTLAEFNSTVSPPRSNQMLDVLATDKEVSGQFKNQSGHRGKGAGARPTATKWKTAMLVLSPFAFILGLIILTLNVRYNKKKKLSALKSYPESCNRAGLQEQSPVTVTAGSWQRSMPASRSPPLQHGEILIEWKDGTVTPLFDNANF